MAGYDDVLEIGAAHWAAMLSDSDARCLLAIFEAMRRVDGGTYGMCLNCGGAIDNDRLKAFPEVAICVVCPMFEFAPIAEAAVAR